MRRFKEGDELTLEDVEQSIREAEEVGRRIITDNTVKFTIKNGVKIFDSFEDMERYYGGPIRTVEEVFNDIYSGKR